MNLPDENDIVFRDGRELRIVGRYALRSDAYDRALVVLAMEIAHWLLAEADEYWLCVEPKHAEAVRRELAKFEGEREQTPRLTTVAEKHSTDSLFIAALLMTLFFAAQNRIPPRWEDAGVNASDAVLRGEWWRVLTALTLHADFSHIGANLAAGLVLAAFLLPLLGAGWTWLAIISTGAIGNWLDAWGHRGEMHNSIGASTAVFGALGLQVGAEIAAHFFTGRRVAKHAVLLPLGAGFALLAFLGVGDEHTDFVAHLCGLIVGVPFGAALILAEVKKRTPRAAQTAFALAAPVLLLLAWVIAIAHTVRAT